MSAAIASLLHAHKAAPTVAAGHAAMAPDDESQDFAALLDQLTAFFAADAPAMAATPDEGLALANETQNAMLPEEGKLPAPDPASLLATVLAPPVPLPPVATGTAGNELMEGAIDGEKKLPAISPAGQELPAALAPAAIPAEIGASKTPADLVFETTPGVRQTAPSPDGIVAEAKPSLPDTPPEGRLFAQQLTAAIDTAHAEGTPVASAVQAVIAQASPAAKVEPATAIVDRPLGAPEWGDAVAQRIVWFARQGEERAALVLNPPHLGRIEVQLALAGDAASAQFASHSPVVREALEAALPRLREALAEAGITLGQTQIGAEFPRSSPQGRENAHHPAPGLAEHHPSTVSSLAGVTAIALKSGRGLVDVFA